MHVRVIKRGVSRSKKLELRQEFAIKKDRVLGDLYLLRDFLYATLGLTYESQTIADFMRDFNGILQMLRQKYGWAENELPDVWTKLDDEVELRFETAVSALLSSDEFMLHDTDEH
jgi:hypothetical protein